MNLQDVMAFVTNLSKDEIVLLKNHCGKILEDIKQKEFEQRKNERLTSLKVVDRGDYVFYIGRFTNQKIPYGQKVKKVKDNRTCMVVEWNKMNWRVSYELLSTTQPNEQQIRDFNMMKRILS